MKKKIALITGVTGQDGAYLAEFLLSKNYIVHGLKRRSSSINTKRIDHIYQEKISNSAKFILHHGDMTDTSSIFNLMSKVKPDEVYNLAAQSHVAVSFEQPEYTTNSDALGTLRILESIRYLKLKNTRFYQAGTSELFGGSKKIPQNEKTPFYPKSPYGVAKLYAHWITVNYRESYNIFASNGILFNHESPERGETFVTRKIVIGLCKIKKKIIKKLYLGNLYAKRDWGHASDYVKAMWLILQQPKPDDFVIATGKQYTVKHFINLVAKELNIKLHWKGKGIKEKAFDKNGKIVIECHKNYFRPSEVDNLLGDYSKAKKILGWKPKISIKSLVKEMVKKDLDRV
jgi:GDPmannose 4,6-dehydratase